MHDLLHAKDNMSYEEFFFYVSSFITSFKRLLTMKLHAKDNMSYEEFFFYVSSFITS